jgi:hypothetical protein
MYNYSSSTTVTNCIFAGNTADYGGGMYNSTSSPTVTNCTFRANSAAWEGGGMRNSNSSPTVTNCIIWGNTAPSGSQISTYTVVTYSNIQGGWPGTGNIDADPCFVDADNPDPNLWDLHLRGDSPCIDAGDTTAVSLPLDMDGHPRALDVPYIPNTGRGILGSLHVVDMGTYEFQPCQIPGDSNCDGAVDFKDLAILCNNWLAGAEGQL